MAAGGIILLIYKKWKSGVALLLLDICVNSFGHIIALHPFHHRDGELKAMTFNVNSPGELFHSKEKDILSLIICEDPDFMFLTELGEKGNAIHSCLKTIYPYTNIQGRLRDDQEEPFYSKWPIDTVEVLSLPHHYHSIYRVKIRRHEVSFCVYCCHLTSNFKTDSNNRIKSIIEGHKRRAREATVIAEEVKKDDCISIILGDFNDLSGSYVLRTIESAGTKDAWWSGGFGYGSTFHDHGLSLRLDHILYEDRFLSLCEVKTIKGRLSDHNPVISVFKVE